MTSESHDLQYGHVTYLHGPTDTRDDLEERVRRLQYVEELSAGNTAALDDITLDLDELQAELEQARQAAALVMM